MAFLILALGFTQFSLRKEAIAAKPIHIGMLGGGAYFFGKSMAKSGGLLGDLLLEFLQTSVEYEMRNMDNGLSLKGDQVQLCFILFILPR